LLLLEIVNLCVLLSIHLGLLCRFRGHMMACCISNAADRGCSDNCPANYSSS